MSSGELLTVQPTELKFTFELKKQSSCSLQLLNNTDHYVAFKVKTTSPKKYCVRPNTGVVLPKSTCDVTVTMQAQREAPPDLQCKDKFLVQSIIAPYGAEPKDINQEMFNKESGNAVEECKLRVVYIPSPKPPSPVPEESEEGSSPRLSLQNGKQNIGLFESGSRDLGELKAKLTEARVMLSKLTEERNAVVHQTQQLQQELASLRQGTTNAQAGFSVLYCFIVALLGILVGYLVRT
uniref:MSP domain-containing protein n=1 Tax=Araucaria cunninghamii TaxID=56994 RepID=A0A0D6QTF5_ARACU